jgi:hypothetical protein
MSALNRRIRRRRADDGLILPLVIGYVMIALALVIVIVDITAVHLQRNRLYALADGAALTSANAIDIQAFYHQSGLELVGGVRPVPLTDQSVRASVREYLLKAAAGADLSEVAMAVPTGSPDPGTAQVTLTARARLPLFGAVIQNWWSGVPISVTVHAQARDPS